MVDLTDEELALLEHDNHQQLYHLPMHRWPGHYQRVERLIAEAWRHREHAVRHPCYCCDANAILDDLASKEPLE